MAPSTAFCFTLIGVGLIAHLLKAALRWIPRVVASVVLAVVCAKLVEIFGDLNFGIDPWFVRNPGLFGAVPTGRMAPMKIGRASCREKVENSVVLRMLTRTH